MRRFVNFLQLLGAARYETFRCVFTGGRGSRVTIRSLSSASSSLRCFAYPS